MIADIFYPDCWYFLPYIYPNDHQLSMFYLKKKKLFGGFCTHPYTKALPWASRGLQLPRDPSCKCPYIFCIISWKGILKNFEEFTGKFLC